MLEKCQGRFIQIPFQNTFVAVDVARGYSKLATSVSSFAFSIPARDRSSSPRRRETGNTMDGEK